MKRKLARIVFVGFFGYTSLFSTSFVYAALVALGEQELSEASGQAAFATNYLAPNAVGNNQPNTGFYKLGIQGELALNVNINKIQLGCGGVNGPGCDIDIDKLSLSGISSTSNGRASSDAVMTNPFIELAIKNPTSLSTREISGFRLSAEKFVGLLTAGTENSTTPNGINSLSGYLMAQSDSSGQIKGLANTGSARFNAGTFPINGALDALSLSRAYFRTTSGGINIPALSNLPFTAGGIKIGATIGGVAPQTRVKSVPISTTIGLPQIDLNSNYPSGGRVNASNGHIETQGGPLNAVITGCDALVFILGNAGCLLAYNGRQFSNIQLNGSVTNVKANVTINQALGYIHSIPVNSPFYLGLQKENIRYPNAKSDDVAQRGWWLSIADPVNLGSVNPTQPIDISPTFPALASALTTQLTQHPATTNDLGGILSGNGLQANGGTISLANSPLSLILKDLQITGQNFAPNCYGGYKFC